MIKVADINISEDNCGPYVIKLLGNDAQYFKVVGKELYFLLDQPCKNSYTVTISIEDLANRFVPVQTSYTLSSPDCVCVSTTTTTSTTTTIFPSTTTTTTTLPLSCSFFGRGVTNFIQNGSFYIGTVRGRVSMGDIWGNNNYGYTSDSYFDVAAVHAGLVVNGQSKTLKFEILGLKNAFPSTTSWGITSLPYNGTFCAIKISDYISITTTTLPPIIIDTVTTTLAPSGTTTTIPPSGFTTTTTIAPSGFTTTTIAPSGFVTTTTAPITPSGFPIAPSGA